jgi:CheY-like chemotaxis protein
MAQHRFDYAFLDAKLPDMDDLDLARRIKESAPGIRIVMVSCYYYQDDDSIQAAISRGLIEVFINKPFLQHTKHVRSSIDSTNLADLLERILEKGIVIAGDIKIRLVEVELLTLQIRLVICSVDKAKELGIDWWVANPAFNPQTSGDDLAASLTKIDERLGRLESVMATAAP